MNHDPRSNPDFDVLTHMRSYGGGFVQHIATAWMYADAVNRVKLYEAFGHYYERYAAEAVRTRNAEIAARRG